MNEKRLIVNADDFGMSRGISDAIVRAHLHGFLSSTSLMANMPAAEYAIARHSDVPVLSMGIHLNICQGKPTLPAREWHRSWMWTAISFQRRCRRAGFACGKRMETSSRRSFARKFSG